jgi:regulator of sirC expression with transglutaminase-like and TPR domain
MIRQRDALFRLLRDDDDATLALVKAQLASGGAAALDELSTLLAVADPKAASHVREVIADIEDREADEIFSQLCADFAEHGDLEEMAWRLAATFTPGDPFKKQRAALDAWGSEVARRLPKAHTSLDRVETLVEFLTHEARLRGNEEDYYNIDNSLLPAVIKTRRGIPISLSLVYILVGRRAGLAVHGVALPGHFLVRHEDVFVDPFHGGRRVGLAECRGLVQEQDIVLTPQHLAPATSRHILVRMLTNIYYVAGQIDPPLAAKVGGWLEALRVRNPLK